MAQKLFQQVCCRDLEGIVGKWKHGTYLDGSTLRTSWMKVKNPNYSQMAGRNELFKKRARAQNASTFRVRSLKAMRRDEDCIHRLGT